MHLRAAGAEQGHAHRRLADHPWRIAMVLTVEKP
jgi:hypothetical protein